MRLKFSQNSVSLSVHYPRYPSEQCLIYYRADTIHRYWWWWIYPCSYSSYFPQNHFRGKEEEYSYPGRWIDFIRIYGWRELYILCPALSLLGVMALWIQMRSFFFKRTKLIPVDCGGCRQGGCSNSMVRFLYRKLYHNLLPIVLESPNEPFF